MNTMLGDAGQQAGMQSAIDNFANSRPAGTVLDVVTLTPTGNSSGGGPLVISGTAGAGTEEMFLIDLRSFTSSSGGGASVQLDNIEFASIVGTATITGGTGSNYVVADDSSQFISLGADDDTLVGGGGDDSVGSAGGNDIVSGADGNDVVFGGADQDAVYGNQASDIVYGNQGLDTLYGGQDSDTLFGGQHADLIYGNKSGDIAYGNLGADTLYGGQDADTLFGGQGNDVISAGIGDDILFGNRGDDVLDGGSGNDTFAFAAIDQGADTIIGFDGAGGDRIDVPDTSGVVISTAGTDVLLTYDGGTVQLSGVLLSQFNADYLI
jgi:Ca2+-binding RTX toxin-like protein